ncbi:hypothetical protein AB4561_19855 [Vibrio sp. 10N.222.55.A3]|uniref:hypothetical protein n=1 Tax=unclassified Vibrio TaxID=2614977 RepID=UPI0035535650
MALEAGEKRDYDPARIHMICDIYFSKLSKPIIDLVELNGDVLEIREQFKEKYKLGKTKDDKMATIYLSKIDELVLACKSIEEQVAYAIKNV